MSCFLACFGFPSRRRRPTPTFISADHTHACYNPLDYVSGKDIHSPSNPIIPHPGISHEDVNRTGVALKKKVTFGASIVITYGPLEDDDCDKEEEKGPSGKDSFASQMNTYPPSYRYQNLTENWDEEEDDMIYEESDELLDDDDDDIEGSNEEDSDPVESEDDKEDKTDETKRSRQYMSPVLLPVENVTQWRTIKAKHKRSAKATIESKENIESEIIDQNG